MNKLKLLSLIAIYSNLHGHGIGQELLTKDLAVEIALENNFDIKAANNMTKIAENNAALKNSDFYPHCQEVPVLHWHQPTRKMNFKITEL